MDFDLNLVIPDKGLTLADGAIDPWNRPKYRPWYTELKKQAGELGVPLDVPWRELPEQARETVLRGKGGFAGIYGFFAQMEKKKYKLHVRVMLSKYRGYAECPDCRGQRCGPGLVRRCPPCRRATSATSFLTVADVHLKCVAKPIQATLKSHR